jgi:transcriptional regulator
LDANEIPLLLLDSGGLRGHVSRANPVWQHSQPEALAIFKGRNDYISPSWYPSKQEHGRVVPTWNYSVVHAHGTLEWFEDKERLRQIVDDLTRTHEAQFAQPWHTTDAPPEYIEGLLNAIVGFDLKISRLEGKWKQSQNRPEADRDAVRRKLAP